MKFSKLTAWSLLLVTSIVLFSCDNEDSTNIIKLRVNHYVQPTRPMNFSVNDRQLVVQKGAEIGSNEWQPFSAVIRDFYFEAGYTYDLLIKEEEWCHGCQDVSSKRYTLLKVLTREKVRADETFALYLSMDEMFGNVTLDENDNFVTINGTAIDCGSNCEELSERFSAELEGNEHGFLLVQFKHGSNNTLQLVQILE